MAANTPSKHRTHFGIWARAGLLALVINIWGFCKDGLSFFKWGLDWRGRIDEASATYRDLGGLRSVIGAILNPPGWLLAATLLVGLALIYFDLTNPARKGRRSMWSYAPLVPILGGPVVGLIWLGMQNNWSLLANGDVEAPAVAQPALGQKEMEEEAKRTSEAIKQLRDEYKRTPGALVLVDGEFPPNDWMNKRLREMGINTTFGGGIDAQNRATTPTVDVRTAIQRLSNDNLKSSTLSFSSNLRTFANNFIANFVTLSRDPDVSDKNGALQKMNAAGTTEYQNTYVGLSREYKNEIKLRLKRIGKFPPYKTGSLSDDGGARDIDLGFFQPLSLVSAANYLEFIARQLPPD